MGDKAEQPSGNLVISVPKTTKSVKCLSCGSALKRPRRRYCSNECHQKINWVLALSKGLLKAFSTRYAAFSFTDDYVILDVLPAWSKGISRFICERKSGNKPAEDLKNLVLQSGSEWHNLIGDRKSKSYASFFLLEKNHNQEIDPSSVKPEGKVLPKLSAHESSCLKLLQLNKETLCAEGQTVKINSAYRKLAKLHHPDAGGDEEKFKQLNAAHEQMLLWAKSPQYNNKRALCECWSYNSYTDRWSPPL